MASKYGHRTVGDLIRVLVFNAERPAQARPRDTRPVLETLLLKLFGMNSLLVLDHRKDDSWSTKCYFVIVGEASASRPLGNSFSSHSHQASTDIQEAINWRSENAVALYDDEFSSGDEGIHMIQSK